MTLESSHPEEETYEVMDEFKTRMIIERWSDDSENWIQIHLR